jgi:hypothetical protein
MEEIITNLRAVSTAYQKNLICINFSYIYLSSPQLTKIENLNVSLYSIKLVINVVAPVAVLNTVFGSRVLQNTDNRDKFFKSDSFRTGSILLRIQKVAGLYHVPEPGYPLRGFRAFLRSLQARPWCFHANVEWRIMN